ncbi:elongator complex protein 6 [Euwallacea similis]|uniref:elongator complex protein 6 n=1 Tax=Euwallacea similis TaxID=1736056 RepID=UPI00344CDD17
MASLTDPTISNPVLSSLKVKSDDKIIFIRENSFADSNFVITHLIKQLLYQQCRICFLMMHNSFEHYQNVGKKLGYDLRQTVEMGNVKVFDPLEDLVENIGQRFEDANNGGILNCLFDSIKKEIASFLSNSNSPIYLVIDDLSHFLDLGAELSEMVQFTNNCINLTGEGNIFTVINSHVSSKNDLVVANSVQYVCDLFVNVSSLKTGRSTDVTGLMTVQRGENEQKFHFRAFDRGVKTFRPGEAIFNLYK